VNGKRVREAELFPGDTLTIADLAFNLEAYEAPVSEWQDAEVEVPVLVSEAVASHSVFVPERAGLTLIDQEYCDLKLESSEKDLVTKPPFYLYGEAEGDALDSGTEPLDLVKDQADSRLEVVTYSSGNVIDIQFIDLKEGLTLSPNPKKGQLWFPALTSDVDVITHTKGRWEVKVPEGFTLSGETELGREAIFLTHGVHQLSLRMVEQTFKVNPLPWFWRERQFYKEATRVAASVFVPFLLLLLISVPEMKPEEVKQITIVYKAIKQADGESKAEISATEVTSKTENTGTKSTEQPKTQPQMASSSAPAQASQVTEQQAAAAPAKPKAYKFSSSVSVDAIVADAAPADASGAGRSPAATSKGMGASTSALAGSANGAGTSVGVGKLGSDAAGSGATSTGAKGLVSKKGFDHSYLEPKTVVLGSMDPELLRKILQEYLPQFRHCYQQELISASKDIKGVIDLDFQISPDGRVSRADIKAKDARFSRKGTNCMADVLRIIEFPKPKGGGVVDVRQPLNFFAETEKI
jgi:hypothetical protein